MSRPTKLTKERHAAIVKLLAAGNYAETSARGAGVHPATYYRWMERGGEEDSGIYSEFREAVKKAEADAEIEVVAMIKLAMPKNWQAGMTYLERKYPDRWSRGERREHTGAVPIVVEIRGADLVPKR